LLNYFGGPAAALERDQQKWTPLLRFDPATSRSYSHNPWGNQVNCRAVGKQRDRGELTAAHPKTQKAPSSGAFVQSLGGAGSAKVDPLLRFDPATFQ
jgi:hypothetical protein